MRHSVANRNHGHFRCVGVGVGPANLSLASLLHSYPDMSNRFIEKREGFAWHDGQLIPGSTLQVSLLKDLVSLSDPANSFSFLSYLHQHGRLYHFINAGFDAVPRQEFRNYLEWASRRNKNVVFGEEVLSVNFRDTFVLRTSTGTVTADNIVVGVGSQPWVPSHARDVLGDTQFHISEFLPKARNLSGKRVAVVGGGQSGAEAFLDLLSRPDDERPRRVLWISRRPNYFPIDDSPFTNDYFTPAYSDYFFQLDRDIRETFNASQVLASDGVSESTLRAIYQRAYVRRFIDGAADLFALYPNRAVIQVTAAGAGGWDLSMAHNDLRGVVEHVEADVIVWATGFRPARMDFLAPIAGRLEREGAEYKIDDHFAVLWDGPPGNHIFVQNAVRQQRGLPDPNLSLNAWRSQRIADRLRGVRTDRESSSFIEWSAKLPAELRGSVNQ